MEKIREVAQPKVGSNIMVDELLKNVSSKWNGETCCLVITKENIQFKSLNQN